MNPLVQSRIIEIGLSILDAMKKMDQEKVKLLLVFDSGQFRSILTIGDIQRAIIRGVDLSSPVGDILSGNKVYAYTSDSADDIRRKMRGLRAECMPVLDGKGELVDVLFWNDVFGKDQKPEKPGLDLPVVIMAGGKGTRLKPLTNVIPKPLVPIGDRTILEEIMERFVNAGCSKFYLMVNYKSDMIRFFLRQLDGRYDISVLQEDEPLGTIGSVALLKGKLDKPFFVSNCDILIDQDFRDVYAYHRENRNDITVITALQSIRIPYGVIETGHDGLMTALKEKPEHSYQINTGVYLLNPSLIDEIPEGTFFHITDLMDKVRARGGRVGCFPVSGNAWKDMGQWHEYLKMLDVL
ncbi:MAG: nucleotidyltransferase family protein [Bacteroidales bacterium]|nr:nucleotidyltransferase family protein [Bacteroidales bacterium]